MNTSEYFRINKLGMNSRTRGNYLSICAIMNDNVLHVHNGMEKYIYNVSFLYGLLIEIYRMDNSRTT